MEVLKGWIRGNPAIAFYIICFAISWLLWLPFILSPGDLAQLAAVVGVFGPALACVIVSRISSPPAREPKPLPFWLSFLAGWILSTFAWLTYSGFSNAMAHPVVLVIFAALALVPAYLIASAISGPSGVRRTLSSLAQLRGGWGWYVLAVAWPLASRLASVWLSKQLGWELLSNPYVSSNFMELAGSVLVIFFYTLIYAGGLNEEAGWTGLALPRLLARFNPLVATILIWGLWMLWHVPLHLSGNFDLSPHVLLGSFFGRFLLTWLFMRSSGGVLTAMLLHTSVNVTSQFVPLTYASLLIDAGIGLLVIIAGRMWRRVPEGSPAVLLEESLAA